MNLPELIWNALRDVACSTKRKASCIVLLNQADVTKAINRLSIEDITSALAVDKPSKLAFDLTGLTEEQVALFQTAVTSTLEQLNVDYEYDEISPDLTKYSVGLDKCAT